MKNFQKLIKEAGIRHLKTKGLNCYGRACQDFECIIFSKHEQDSVAVACLIYDYETLHHIQIALLYSVSLTKSLATSL